MDTEDIHRLSQGSIKEDIALFLMVICHQSYSELENIPMDETIRLFVRFMKRIADLLNFFTDGIKKPTNNATVVPDVMNPSEVTKIAEEKRKKKIYPNLKEKEQSPIMKRAKKALEFINNIENKF
jgi:hypothetical protein